jgi:hypothetical protein
MPVIEFFGPKHHFALIEDTSNLCDHGKGGGKIVTV